MEHAHGHLNGVEPVVAKKFLHLRRFIHRRAHPADPARFLQAQKAVLQRFRVGNHFLRPVKAEQIHIAQPRPGKLDFPPQRGFRRLAAHNEFAGNEHAVRARLPPFADHRLGASIIHGSIQRSHALADGFIQDAKGLLPRRLPRGVRHAMRQFVNNDPDGNGQDDTQGYVSDYTRFLSAYGLINGVVADENGNACQWYTHPKVKDMLNHLQELYAEGLIYPEIFTIAWGEDWELINNDVCGVWASSTNSLNSWAATRPPLTLLNDPDSSAVLLSFPGICDENGKTIGITKPSPMSGIERFVVRWDVSDEKLAKILELVNFAGGWNPDREVTATLWYGEKGVDWDWSEDGTTPIAKTGLTPGERGTQIFSRTSETGETWRWITYEPLFAASSKYYVRSDGGIWNADLVYEYKQDFLNETDAGAILNEYSADWVNVRDAYFLDVITGKMSAEEGWDAYIQQLNDLRYDEYLSELDKCATTEELVAMYAE